MNFQKTEEDTLPNMFNGASIITLIPKPNKKIIKKGNYKPPLFMNIYTNPFQSINKMIYKKDNTL